MAAHGAVVQFLFRPQTVAVPFGNGNIISLPGERTNAPCARHIASNGAKWEWAVRRADAHRTLNAKLPNEYCKYSYRALPECLIIAHGMHKVLACRGHRGERRDGRHFCSRPKSTFRMPSARAHGRNSAAMLAAYMRWLRCKRTFRNV